MEAGRHLRGDHHAKGVDNGVDVAAVLAARVEDEVLGHNDPVKVGQREVALDVEDGVLAYGDAPIAGAHLDVAVKGAVACVGRRLCVGVARILGVVVVGRQVELLRELRHLEGEPVDAGAPVLLVGFLLGVELLEDELRVLLNVLGEEGGGVDVVGPRGVRGGLRAKQLAIML